jgi:hypothetical protein
MERDERYPLVAHQLIEFLLVSGVVTRERGINDSHRAFDSLVGLAGSGRTIQNQIRCRWT